MKAKIFDLLMHSKTNVGITLQDLGFQASEIAETLGVSRNLVSQYLNKFVQEDIVVKIASRPVFFYAREVLEKLYCTTLKSCLFTSFKELEYALQDQKETRDFECLIGFDGSLHSTVEQCKAAISYPPKGLPLLLYGPTGSGKSFIARLTYEYAVNNGIMDSSKNFVVVNCSEYANNPELLTANLFGSKKGSYTGAEKDNHGLLSIADGGILFLDEVHCLLAECQEKLFLYMDKGIYHMLGDNENWYTSKVLLIFATTENPEDALLKTLLRRIPIIAHIPSLQNRPLKEKKNLLFHMFQEEEIQIGKKIRISSLVHDTLLKADFVGNIGSMKNTIKATCANALLLDKSKGCMLDIQNYHLPEHCLQQSPIISIKQSDDCGMEMISIEQKHASSITNSKILRMYQQILNHFHQYCNQQKISMETFFDEATIMVDDYLDYIVFEKKSKNNLGLDFTRKMVDKIFGIVINRYGMKVNNNHILNFTRYIYEYTKDGSDIKTWVYQHEHEVQIFVQYIEKHLLRDSYIAKEIVENIKLNLDIELDMMSYVAMILNLRRCNTDTSLNNTLCIILAHGYSTASSVADAVNHMLSQYIFDAIDMQLDVSVEKITEQLNDFLTHHNTYEELILLVDMGSLEKIYKGLACIGNSNIGIINNVSTKTALQIGEGIKQGLPIESVLKRASQEEYKYTYINNRVKKNAILSVCSTDVCAAEKITELLKNSLPYDINLEIIAYDFKQLIDYGIEDAIFQKYNVVMIIGTMNPNIEQIPFIAVEDIVLNTNLNQLQNLFSNYLDDISFDVFNQNMVKNFTLNNVLNHLTILNANKLLEDVEEIVDEVEKKLDLHLSASNKIGLYVHMCCMVERLIMKNNLEHIMGIEEFEKKHIEFIQIVRESFDLIGVHYSVELTSTEIALIYNYFV